MFAGRPFRVLIPFILALHTWGCEGANHGAKNGIAFFALAALLTPPESHADCPSGYPTANAYLADTVVEAPGRDDFRSFKDPAYAVNGICGGGDNRGSADVYTLGDIASEGYVVLEWRWSDG